MQITFNEYMYYGLLLTILVVYLTLYVKHRHEIAENKRLTSRWGIVASFALVGLMGLFFHLINWPAALVSSAISCAISYYIIFIKYPA